MRFLVVEDMPIMIRVIANTLKSLGYDQVLEAENGFDALAKLKDNQIDFVITDWLMPNMSGLELAKKIRADEEMKDIPIVMITTLGNKEAVLEAMNAKVNNYVVKPFTSQILKEKIQATLNQIEERRSKFAAK